MLREIGRTTDDRPVFAGVYEFTETFGLQLEVVLERVHDRGGVVAWPEYMRAAEAAGMKRPRVMARIQEATSDVFGGAVSREIMKRIGN